MALHDDYQSRGENLLKYVKKIPRPDEAAHAQYMEKGWRKLKEPSNLLLACVASLPFMLIGSAINLALLVWLNPEMFNFLNAASLKLTFRLEHLLLCIMALYTYMFLHEMLHAMLIPGFSRSDKTVWGLRAGFGFVYTAEQISKWRFVVISLAPYCVLSVIATLALSALNVMNGYIAFILLANAAGSCVDFLNVTLVLVQVPHHGKLVSNGNQTYYSGK